MTFRACLLLKPQIALGFNSLMGFICSLSHRQCTIDGSMNGYSVAPVSNKALVCISLLLLRIQSATKAFLAKKLPSKKELNIINGFSSSLLTTSRKDFAFLDCSTFFIAMQFMVCLFIVF